MNPTSSLRTTTIARIALFTLTASCGWADGARAMGYPTEPVTITVTAPSIVARKATGQRPGQRPLPQYGTSAEQFNVIHSSTCPRSAYCRDLTRGTGVSLTISQ